MVKVNSFSKQKSESHLNSTILPPLDSLVCQLNKKCDLKDSSSLCYRYRAAEEIRNGDSPGNHIVSKARAVNWGKSKMREKRKHS